MGELPVGWVEVKGADTFEQISTTHKKVKTKECLDSGLFPVIDQGQKLISGYINDEKKVIEVTDPVCIFGDHTRVIKWVEDSFVPGADGTKVLVAKEFLLPKYFYYQLKGIDLPDKGYSRHFQFLKKSLFKVAPLNEQIRIANKLDSLLAKVEAAQTRLNKIPTLLKRFRQSVLAAATSGELTKEWRGGKSNSWNEIKVADIVKKIEAGKNIKCDERPPQEDEFGIIKISAVTWGFYNENKSKTLLDTTKFIENRRIQVGDFLISRANTLELLGMPVIVQKVSKNLMLSDKVLRLVVDEAIDKKWLNFFLRSQRGRKEIESRATGNQQSMRNIGQKALLDIDLPYPDREEQKQIVQQVEALFALADKVEQQYQQARLRTDKLTQSLLAKAFKGELVPQNSNDEPAKKLLARIQAEREKLKPAKKPRKSL